MNRLMKIIIWPFAAAFELIAFCAILFIGIFSPSRALKCVKWIQDNLPDRKWYLGF